MTAAEITNLLKEHNLSVESKIIRDLLNEHAIKHNELRVIYKRYKGDVPIYERTFDDETKVNAQLANDYRGIIIDSKNGYFLGHPVGYMINEQEYSESDLAAVNKTLDEFKYNNNIEDLDSETGEYASVCGYGARLLYVNMEGIERVMNIKPWEAIFIYDSTVDELQYALIYYKIQVQIDPDSDETIEKTKVEWYDKTNVTFYISDDNGGFVYDPNEPKNPKPHLFDYIPVVKFQNNNLEMGDFEKVESLVDAYDRNLSDVQNEVEEFRLAYMAFYGIEPTAEDIKLFRQTGGISFPENTDGKFITKDLNGATQFIENHKDTLNENIYKFSKTIDMSDDSFSGSAQSGESRKWKLIMLENDTIKKERKFVKGLREMFKILASAWNKKNIPFEPTTLTYQFKRNLPADLQYEADVTTKLKGNVSEETRLSLLSFVPDANKEKEAMKEDLTDGVNLDDVSVN